MYKLAPSILAADFAELGKEVRSIRDAGADYVHIDIMDGIFVPNISMGFPVIKAVREHTELVLDVHLMIDRPLRYVDRFCEAGADYLTIHQEADSPENTVEALRRIRSCGIHPAISIKPGTPAEVLDPYLSLVDMILIMTVEPGFGGQSFMAEMMPKITLLRKKLDAVNPLCDLEVDGGITEATSLLCKKSGANVFVAGSAFFHAEDRKAFTASIKGSYYEA